MQALPSGQYRMEVCGPLSKLDEHGFNDKEGRRVEGVGGKVDFLGGFVKLSLPLAHGRLVCAALKEHVGQVVHVVGVPAPHDGVLKIVRVLSAHVEGRQVYSDARESGAEGTVEPGQREQARAGILGMGRKAA